jgi:hypothetical protein
LIHSAHPAHRSSKEMAYSELWVCFRPPRLHPPANVLVLSFLPPGAEEHLAGTLGEQFVSARDVQPLVHADARRAYVDLIAGIGATACIKGQTLRQALKGADGYSRWWLHKISEKDCGWDEDPTYLTIIQLLCARQVIAKHGITRTRVVGAPTIAMALSGRGCGPLRTWAAILKALAFGIVSRIAFAAWYLQTWWIVRSAIPRTPAGEEFDVALEGHWDWSVRPTGTGIEDRYFGDLPHRLERAGLRVGWFAWCEPSIDSRQPPRSLRAVITSAATQRQVVLLESFLGVRDILSATIHVRHLLTGLRFILNDNFRAIFRVAGYDIFPVMLPLLLRDFAGAGICRRDMLLRATTRATAQRRPKILLSFLEFFLHARAMYAGARLGSPTIQLWTAQHGAYCSDKTMCMFDPEREIEGRQDGCALVVPDRMYVMGHLAETLWTRNGFRPDRVVVAGGLRFQRMRVQARPLRERDPEVTVLLVCAMTRAWDLELCEAATLASAGILNIRLKFRDHPHYRLSKDPAFASFKHAIEVTTGSAEEDLESAQLVLFTYSGMAEEALLKGIPVWQWRWAGIMPTVFTDVPVVPTFSSVSALRGALHRFIADPDSFRPSPDVQRSVLNMCFGPAPTQASARIAADMVRHVRVCGASARAAL